MRRLSVAQPPSRDRIGQAARRRRTGIGIRPESRLACLAPRDNNARMPVRAAPPPPLRLLVRPPEGPAFVREFTGGELVIGRAREADLSLLDESLSRRHARLFVRGAQLHFEDLGSRNGSFLNDVPVSAPRRVEPGDRIVLGGTEIVVRRPGAIELTPSETGDATAIFDVTSLSGATGPRIAFRDLAEENRALAVLSRAGGLLIAHRPLPETLDTMLDLALEAFGAERAAIALLSGADDEPNLAAARGVNGDIELQLSRTVVRAVLEQRRALAVTDVAGDPELSLAESVRIQGVRSLMCAPLWDGAGVQGLLYADRLVGRGHYGPDDLKVLSMLANLVAMKIENARLIERALQNERLEEELSVARGIQERLISTTAPAIEGLAVAGVCRPCSEVGGDFFDVFPLPGGRHAVVIADVCGKGAAGALLAASLQAALRGGRLQVATPAERLTAVNSFVYEHSPADRYITAACVEVDPSTGETIHSSAGHPPVIVLRRDGSVERLVEGGVPLGLFPDSGYRSGTTTLAPGDRLLFHTDGITEASPGPGRDPTFGAERLIAAARSVATGGAAATCEAIIRDVDAFTAGARLRDDATLVVVEKT